MNDTKMSIEISQKLFESFKKTLMKYRYKNFSDYYVIRGRVDEGLKEEHSYLKKVDDWHSFKLKTDHSNVIAEILLLEDLYKAIQEAPSQAIVFHMNGKNDFANWIRDCVKDSWLGSKIEEIELEDPEVTREKLLNVMGDRVSKLKQG